MLLMKSVLRVARMSSNTAFTRGSASGLSRGATVDMRGLLGMGSARSTRFGGLGRFGFALRADEALLAQRLLALGAISVGFQAGLHPAAELLGGFQRDAADVLRTKVRDHQFGRLLHVDLATPSARPPLA